MILENLQKCTTYNIDKSNFHINLKHHTTNNKYVIIISTNTNSYHKNLCHNRVRQKPLFKTIFLILSHILYHEIAFTCQGSFIWWIKLLLNVYSGFFYSKYKHTQIQEINTSLHRNITHVHAPSVSTTYW
jgi:hypothetical protein